MCVSGWFKKKPQDEKKEVSEKCCGETSNQEEKTKSGKDSTKEKISAG